MTLVPTTLRDIRIAPPLWEWREGQHDLAERIAASDKKIIIMEAEPGVGKSVIPIAAAKSQGKNAIVLVQTRQLEAQYLRDFPSMKMMQGRRWFKCNIGAGNADSAPCTIGVRCELAGRWDRVTKQPIGTPTCHYFRQKAAAKRAQVSIHNYAYWLGESQSAGIFASTDWIICDEAHELDRILMANDVIEISFTSMADFSIYPQRSMPTNIEGVVAWAKRSQPAVDERITNIIQRAEAAGLPIDTETASGVPRPVIAAEAIPKSDVIMKIISELRTANNLYDSIGRIASLRDDSTWVVDRDDRALFLKPIFGRLGFKQILLAAKEKVILMSAFLAPSLLMETLGIDPDDAEVIIAPPVWDRTNSGIYYCPVGKFNYETTNSTWKYVIAIADEFIKTFAPKKGLMHVPSIRLRDRILSNTKLRNLFVAYDSRRHGSLFPDKEQAIEIFKRRSGQTVLLGQSISTGLDIPYDPEFQIIMKLNFPPTNDPAIKARMEVDPHFYPHIVICEIVQTAGRIKRAADHDGPTVILDEQFGWFFAANAMHFPTWFRKALTWKGWETYPDIYANRKRIAFKNGVLL